MKKSTVISAETYRKNLAKKSKYFSKKTVIDGITFHSQKEGAAYVVLKNMQINSEIKYFLRQVPFYLPANIRYLVDFMLVYHDGRIRYIDIKGFSTQTYLLKKKQVEFLYPVTIEEEI